MMKVNVAHVRQAIGEGQSFRFAGTTENLFRDSDPLWIDGPVEIVGEVVNKGQFLTVQGEIKASAALVCNRCLNDFTLEVAVPFQEDFQASDARGPKLDGEDWTVFEGDEIDITELVRESLVLAEPLKTVCSESCRGFCGKCGINRNHADCTCDQDDIDPRLAALQKLLVKE